MMKSVFCKRLIVLGLFGLIGALTQAMAADVLTNRMNQGNGLGPGGNVLGDSRSEARGIGAPADTNYSAAISQCATFTRERTELCVAEAQFAKDKAIADISAQRDAAPVSSARLPSERNPSDTLPTGKAPEKREIENSAARLPCGIGAGNAQPNCLNDTKAK